MHRTLIMISDYDIQGVVLSENNEIISINHVTYLLTKDYELLNKDIMEKAIIELITKLEQYCNISIQNVYVCLHGFIPCNINIKLLSMNESIKVLNDVYERIDNYYNYYINNKYYPFMLDTKKEIYINSINVYTNKLYIECLTYMFNNQGINIENITYAPLQLIKNYTTNTIIAYLYNNKLVIAVNKNHEINIYVYDDIDSKGLSNYLNYCLGNVEQITFTRKFLNKINEYIHNLIKKDIYNIYYAGKFVFFPDLIEYLKYYDFNNDVINKCNIDFLKTDDEINVNLVYYGSLLTWMKNYK